MHVLYYQNTIALFTSRIYMPTCLCVYKR